MPPILPLVALICGILLAGLVPATGWFTLVTGGILFLGGLALPGHRRAIVLILTGLVLLGIGRAQHQMHPPMRNNDLRHLADGRKHRIEATVIRSRLDDQGRSRLDLEASATVPGGKPAVYSGSMRLTVDGCATPFVPGEQIAFTVRLKTPNSFGNPGEFNYPRHLASRDIHLVAYLSDSAKIAHSGESGSWRFRLMHWRSRAAAEIDERLPGTQAALLRALLLGDRDRFPEQLRTRIAAAGLSHLLAISGLHLGLVGGLFFAICFYIWCRSERMMLWQPPYRILPLVLVPVLTVYTILTGAATSTLRALLVWTLGALLLAATRRYRPLDVLWFVVLLMLLIQPLWLFEAGLQLSVAGAAGILLFLPSWNQKIPEAWRKLAGLPLATLAANVTTSVLVGFHFHQFAPAGLATNLFAIPMVGFLALPAGLIGLSAHLAGVPGGTSLLSLAGRVAEFTVDLADSVTKWPLLHPTEWFPDPAQLLAAAGAVIFLYGLSTRRTRLTFASMAVTLIVSILPFGENKNHIRVTAISVGQGESILLETPAGKRYLVDGGGLRYSRFDIGNRLLLPTLGWLGVHRLDGVILSHPHPDHYLGLQAVLEKLPPTQFITGLPREKLPRQLASVLERQTEYLQLSPGWHHLVSTADTDLRIWVPDQKTGSVNDRSLVVYLGSAGQGVLLTGDLERAGVNRLLEQLPDITVSLLKIPHHGSRHSGTDRLLDRLRPAAALVSAGRDNVYRFPSISVIHACQSRGVKLWRTDRDGCIRLVSTPKGWQRHKGFSIDINL